MRKNSHDCPGCGFNKAMCQCAGGGAADDEKSKSDAEANATSKPNASADNIANNILQEETQIETHMLFNLENHQLLQCTLFARTAMQLVPAMSNSNVKEEKNETTSSGMSMGMKMSSTDRSEL